MGGEAATDPSRAGQGPPPNSPVISERYISASANVSAMAEKTREKVIDRINVPVLGSAKRVLNEFQEEGGYGSQSDALSDLLLEFAKQKKQIAKLEARVKELEAQLAVTKESK